MPLVALGINHKTAPVELRERVAFAPDQLPLALTELCSGSRASEAAILSTCNRTELYCTANDSRLLIRWLSDFHALPARSLERHIYQHPNQHAVKHMLRVASGLDSLVLGEPQILGQVKTAYQTASQAGTLGRNLERLFQHTFSVAKQVRTDTRIGESPVSVAFAAVSLAKQVFDLDQQTALLLGAGETIELVARHLHDAGIERLIIANRTLARAHQLAAPLGGFAIALDEIHAHLDAASIVISSTSSPVPLLDRNAVRRSLKHGRRRPLLMIDIAVPRDIDPAVASLDDVYLYTVDDLHDIIQDNLRSRQAAALKAEEIIEAQTEHFMAWLRAQGANLAIGALRAGAEQTRDELLERARQQLATGKTPEQVLEFLANGLTNKLLHMPSAGLRAAAAAGDVDTLAIIKRLYHLDADLDAGAEPVPAPPRPPASARS